MPGYILQVFNLCSNDMELSEGMSESSFKGTFAPKIDSNEAIETKVNGRSILTTVVFNAIISTIR